VEAIAASESFAISGAECVVALCSLGFAVIQREPGRTLLRSDGHLAVVPDRIRLPPAALDTILRDADVSYLTLLRAISDPPTEPELRVLEA
jgi:hypothetical protein